MEMIYDDRVKDLENKVSYGTLGILNTLVKESDSINKAKLLLVNISTIVRNCFDKDKQHSVIISEVEQDIRHLYTYTELYNPTINLIFYSNVRIRERIPEFAQRAQTPSRKSIESITDQVIKSLDAKPNMIRKIHQINQMSIYFIKIEQSFSYPILIKLMRSYIRPIDKVWLVSHCPIDFYIQDIIKNLEIIDSHTGKITPIPLFGKKVFKDDIPFKRITHMLFGDSDFIKPVIRNRPKALEKLKGINLKLKTERDITIIAMKDLGVMPNQVAWKL